MLTEIAPSVAADLEADARRKNPDHRAGSDDIAAAKRGLIASIGDVPKVFAEVEKHMKERVAEITSAAAAGKPVIPEVRFSDIEAGTVPAEAVEDIRRKGCVVVRQTFPKQLAEDWNDEIGEYLESNRFAEKYRNLPNHMPTRPDGEPLLYPIFWSGPQVKARQDPRLNATRAFINSLWKSESEGKVWFDGSKESTFVDKMRRRRPGDPFAGLVPHIDGGSTHRWTREGYRKVYRHVYSGDWRSYDPFDGAYRTSFATYDYFRSFQGWTALSEMRPGDGVLHLVPISNAVIYLLLRALMPDVPDDDLLLPKSWHATMELAPEHHSLLLPANVPIPTVLPGDTVWWHCDLIHSVADGSGPERWGNIMYIASAPLCESNRAQTFKQLPALLAGRNPEAGGPSLELDMIGRSTVDDLTEVGRKQMALDPWWF